MAGCGDWKNRQIRKIKRERKVTRKYFPMEKTIASLNYIRILGSRK